MKALFFSLAIFCFALSSNAQWNSNTDINLDISNLAVADLQTAHTTDGKTWIAFYQPNTSGNYDMRAQLLDVNGNKLLGPNGLLVGGLTSGTATFVFNVCVDPSDNLIIAYQYEIAGSMKAVVTKVTPQGALPWSDGVVLGDGLAPYPAANASGDVFVVWNNDNPSTCYIQKVSAAGTISWTSPVSVLVGASNSTRGQIVTHPNGDFTLVFQKKGVAIYTTLYAQRYNSDGVALWPAALQLSNLTTASVRDYSVIKDENTVYVGYYASFGNRFSGYVQKITASGTIPWGMNGSAVSTYASGAEPMQQATNIAHDPASGYIWSVSTYCDVNQTEYGVYVQKFDTATGVVQLAPEGKEVYPVSSSFDTQAGSLLLINDAPLFMSYDVNYKIYATLLNGSGDFVWPGNRIVLSSTTASLGSPKGSYAFSGVVNNQAVAVWQETRGGEERAYAQNVIQQSTFNLIQDFESGASSATDCWSAYNQSSTPTTNTFFTSSTVVNAGSFSGGLYSCCGGIATNTPSYYISPVVSSGSHSVDFYIRQSSFFGENFEVGTVSDAQGSNFTLLHTISNWPTTSTWQAVNINITTDATNNRIAFRVPPASLKTYYLDDIVLGDVGNLGPTACNYVPATPTVTATVSASGSTNLCSGGSVDLNCTISATGSYQYEWYYNAVLVSGANASTYSTTSPGSYACHVIDGSNVYVSNAVVITNDPPATPVALSNGPICSGNTLNLTASTTSTGVAIWSWTGPNGFVSESQNPSISNVVTASGGAYNVTVTIANCVSTPATVNVVVVSASILQQPTSVTKNVGENALFVCKSSDPAATFQWQNDSGSGFSNISNAGQYQGATTDSLNVSNLASANNNNRFRCVVTSGSCSDTSAIAVLNINSSSEPTSLTIRPNFTEDIITIKAPASLIGKSYKISDEGGKTVMTGVITGQETEVSLGKLAKGMYFITIITDKKETYKIFRY